MTEFETRTADWLSAEEAIERVLAGVAPLEIEWVGILEARGRALASGIRAKATLPPWDNSAMDGYAVRDADLSGADGENPVSLTVVGGTRAGDAPEAPLEPGQAVRIMTGAPIPPGADTVVRVEDTDAEQTPGLVRVFSGRDQARNIRPGGQDMVEGEEVLQAGVTLGPGQIGVLAGAGHERVHVHRRPKVGIISNGDELANLSEFHRVQAGEAIPETNATTLEAAVAACGGLPIGVGIARDNSESILGKVSAARQAGADLLVTSGGASLGERDLFKRVLEEIGLRIHFWRVKMRPGTPFSFGDLPADRTGRALPVFGLPGNPASTFVTFQLFVRPYILSLAGHNRIHRPVVEVTSVSRMQSPTHLMHFFRVQLEGDPWPSRARLTGSQTSGLVLGQGLAQGLAIVPEGRTVVEPGDTVRVMLLDDMGIGGDSPGLR